MNLLPEPQRIAIHHAGHAVAQTLVGRDRFSVAHVTLGEEPVFKWQRPCARGEAVLDRETLLSIYEFGLVTLAGVAAEERYLATRPPEREPLVAISDLNEWREKAWDVFADPGKIRLVHLNVMRKLREWFAEMAVWQVVESLAAELLDRGTLEGPELRRILAQLPTTRRETREKHATPGERELK